ncbi:2,3-bisphosphoglycerate-independent phosphoglycerate mutase [Methylophilaceae bacterium]|nr:2,3-bisphosphoglycerate-independent phosphoglycerate mutase [Methylophilaceae bacterium]|tara:strand:+ start:562 stop:2106 length:1545 start_codon:yes stop_codon:yes gene_type:complete
MQKKPIVLLILDGFGHSDNHEFNAISKANTPNWDSLNKKYLNTLINASESYVGLPSGQMGNSEVGHLNIGSGRVIHQDIARINLSIKNKKFFSQSLLNENFQSLNKNNKTLHIFGLLSDGGVHSHINHFDAILKLAKQNNLEKVYVHAFLDGRDTPPKSAEKYIASIEKSFQNYKTGELASISGRFYSMDRDNRWERTEAAFNLLVHAKAKYKKNSPQEAIKEAYKRNETDEFITPTLVKINGEFEGIKDNDTIVFMNFRSDRARQITDAILNDNFNHFDRKLPPKNLTYFTLTEYDKKQKKAQPIFEPIQINNSLGQVISEKGKTQLRIAETEKYPHVTFFFNGGEENIYPGEDRILVPSPKVETYDLKPEMSAYEVTDKLCKAIKDQKYDVIICNYANADMVGHTGNIDAAIKAIESLDNCVGKVSDAIKENNGHMLITADHGNIELMMDEKNNQLHTQHTTNLVPFVYMGKKSSITKKNGCLSDIAPTILYIMGEKPPKEMTGKTLIKFNE